MQWIRCEENTKMQNERFENVFLKSKDYFTSVPGLDLEKYIFVNKLLQKMVCSR
jgi:hypothetical protein